MESKYLIYGASGGIGSAISRLLHARGEALHLVARDESKLAPLAEEFGATYTLGDVTDTELFSRATADAGEVLSGLVYAVGTINLRGLGRLTAEDFSHDFQINAMGAALAVQAALKPLKKSPGSASVVLFSSVAAQQGFTFHASVGMAKAAISGLTLALAAELAPKIRVNAIAPSLTQTPLAQGLLASEAVAKAIAGKHALGRLGTAEDIAPLAALLLSPGSDWITGQIFGVDGGRSTLRTQE